MAANEQSVVFSDSAIEYFLSLTAGLLIKSKSPRADAKKDGFGRISELSESHIPMCILQNVSLGNPKRGRIGAFQLILANPAHYANQLQHWIPVFSPDLTGTAFAAGEGNLDSEIDEIKAPSLFAAALANSCRRVFWSVTSAFLWQPAITKKPEFA
ncbi:hypothetical protein [Microcoleus sp. FACHB-672]|uniref:hypothetical protein n=1 Tax=Microcoleus sp. FACHB-672 TaxID=2692825 RepID=UPI001686CC81|nr:hypothetical protein [Microcoleus sp. FACHB-672]MBD2039737.1 hypothetical protein [Microcoleus sp. FACHB-672]